MLHEQARKTRGVTGHESSSTGMGFRSVMPKLKILVKNNFPRIWYRNWKRNMKIFRKNALIGCVKTLNCSLRISNPHQSLISGLLPWSMTFSWIGLSSMPIQRMRTSKACGKQCCISSSLCGNVKYLRRIFPQKVCCNPIWLHREWEFHSISFRYFWFSLQPKRRLCHPKETRTKVFVSLSVLVIQICF